MGSPNTGRSSVGLVIGPLRRRRRSPLLFRLTPASLPPGATFTRSTTATYVDTNGVYQTAGANALRSGHYIGGVKRSNLIPNSGASPALSGFTGTPIVTSGFSDPFGGNAAFKIDLSQTTNNGGGPALPATTPNDTTLPYTVSYYVRADIPGTLQLGPYSTGNGQTIVNVTTQWQRFAVTTTPGSGAVGGIYMHARNSSDLQQFYVIAPQVEQSSSTTAYIPTSGSAVTVVDGGVQSILLEGSRTNSVLWSRDLTNAAWSQAGTGTNAQNAVGLDGTANSATTVSDTDATQTSGRYQAVSVPVDSNTHTIAFWVRKDTDQTRFPQLYAGITGGTAVTRGVWLNTQTGAIVQSTIAGTGTGRVIDGGLWWIVEITLTNNSSALNTTLTGWVFAARGTVIGTDNVAATGSCVVGHVQVELNSPFYSSPIFTTTAAVTRGADALSFATPSPQALTVYLAGTNLGTPAGSGFLAISTVAPYAVLWNNSGSYRLSYPTAGVVEDNVAGTPATGDTFELRAVVGTSAQNGMTRNGGAETLSSTTSGITVPGVWGNQTMQLGANPTVTQGFFALTSFKIAAGVQPLATMRTL